MKTAEQTLFYYQKKFFEPIERAGLNPLDYVVAGGAVRDYLMGETVKDVDIFCSNLDAALALERYFISEKVSGTVRETLSNFYPEDLKWVQIVKTIFFGNNPVQIIENFDFSICAAMVGPHSIETAEHFFEDLACRRLRLQKVLFPLSTLERLQKYIKKGYTACNGTMLELSKAIAKVNFDAPEENLLEFYPGGDPRFVGVD